MAWLEWKKDDIKSIQILRALAALSVVYTHCADNYETPKAGDFGVDIFFIISGFIIAYVVSTNTEHFFMKRFIRIWPMYFISTVVMAFCVIIFPTLINSTKVSVSGFIKSIFFVPYMQYEGKHQPILGQGWTLNFEIFFYLVMFICVLVVRNKKFISLCCIGLLVFFLAALNFFDVKDFILNYYRTGLIPEFIYGIILYMAYNWFGEKYNGKKVPAGIKIAGAVCSAGAFVFLFYSQSNAFMISKNRNIYFGIPAFVVVSSLLITEKGIGENIVTRLLVKIGNASYAMYLFHYFIVVFIARVIFRNITNGTMIVEVAKTTLTIIITIVVSIVTYEMIDSPIQKYFKGVLKKYSPLKQRHGT
jgi:peptidoglycan/LPS O-acetylase OafA/YrhL